MTVVTLSREYGAGGLMVGRAIADALGADFLDSKLVEEVAQRMSCSEEIVRRWDERAEGLILRLLRALRSAHPEFATPGPVGAEYLAGEPPPDRVLSMIEEVMREEARGRDAVIVGRGGFFVLRDWPGVLHVRLIAGIEDRAARLAENNGWTLEEARDRIDRADRERAAYLKHHFGVDWRDPRHFALILNTSMISYESAVDLVVRAAQGIERG